MNLSIRALICAASVALAMCIPFTSASALPNIKGADLRTEHEIIAGLDPATRTMILALPAEIRTQAVLLLKEALPLIDKSVLTYIDVVDEMLEKRINQLVCAGAALGGNMAGEARAALTGGRPTPVMDLYDRLDSRGRKFDAKSAEFLAMQYEDLLQTAAVTSCQVADEATRARVDMLRSSIRTKRNMWAEIEGFCEDPTDCMVKREAWVRAIYTAADKRDLQASGVTSLMEKVEVIRPAGGPFAALKKRVWVQQEDQLIALRGIERSLAAAEAIRRAVARSHLTTAQQDLLKLESNLVSANANLSSVNQNSNNYAKSSADGAVRAKEVLI